MICKMLLLIKPLFNSYCTSEADETFIVDFNKTVDRFKCKINAIKLPVRITSELVSNEYLLAIAHDLLTSDVFMQHAQIDFHNLEQVKQITRHHIHLVVLNSQLYATMQQLMKLSIKLKDSLDKAEQKYRINSQETHILKKMLKDVNKHSTIISDSD